MSSWFRPKKYGFGARPNTWQGWLVTLGFIAFLAAINVMMQPGRDGGSGAWALWLLAAGAFTALFALLAWTKTDGPWRWRWGSDDDGNKGS
jgi:O-antigen/teichoic acid export membrane protein